MRLILSSVAEFHFVTRNLGHALFANERLVSLSARGCMRVPNRWRMRLVLFLAHTVMAYQFQTVPSDGPYFVVHLGMGFAQLGSLLGLYMLPGIVIALPGGMLAQRFGAERVVLSGLALMVLGGALMSLDSVP